VQAEAMEGVLSALGVFWGRDREAIQVDLARRWEDL
jgi:hypothetical protein